ncbi:4Fe-4S ferredoxin, iron-sulfur binding protein [Bradyrhizobium oligotrophicum S58]|uniref:4Fe-4S ferredoxin, iron-sulfur binding protein n=1 Tax=Bradyrhizobium oligotrophicum S58 TaxID=1245469 RepID=M4Z6E0_9BRAD|nr:NAD(P)-binding domain-containing protein [Bradyrhizobium oligotrophicum]BAM89088.1 4Fe-4S ferredoxin, iron-sulfur binding protein [Bradyrhizobium oligotrophicum S58]
MALNLLMVYAAPMLGVWATYMAVRKRKEIKSVAKLSAAKDAGLLEPASLHPIIDHALCIGCGSCVRACPEGDILGLIGGKASLVEPSHCIGHGACKAVCPVNAITLVFGTETRGIDIPNVDEAFQTNVPGIFIAGELGGMGLVRNAIEQGRQAIDSVRRIKNVGKSDMLDVVIVGCGPAGLSASLACLQHRLRFVTLEQDSLGGTVAHFPRGKLVMTAPFTLPLAGKFNFRELSKEQLIAFFMSIVRKARLRVNVGERVEAVTRVGDRFDVRTNRGSHRTHSVLLAIGRRGTPRKLEVPGEEQTKVVYRLIDPEQYRGQHVLVVGGGDAALEAACSIADEPGTTVTLSHRSESFSRAKLKNRQRVEDTTRSGRLRVIYNSSVKRIGQDDVDIDADGDTSTIRNDAVIVCVGGILPTGFLKSMGIEVETKYGTA